MHVEFELPNNNTILSIAIPLLTKELTAWSKQYSVDITHYEYSLGWPRYQLLLPNDQAYTHFALTWNPKQPYFKQYTIVE